MKIIPELTTGTRVRLNGGRVAWTVSARSDTYIVLVRQAAFYPKGEHEYTVIENSSYRYNFVGPGLIMTTLNTIGGGWPIDGRVAEGSQEALDALESGEFQTSHRRRAALNDWTVIA